MLFSDCQEVCLAVRPTPGTVIIFEHDLWHEGANVSHGTKVVMRSDVTFKLASIPSPRDNASELTIVSANAPIVDFSRPIHPQRDITGHENYIWSLTQLRDASLATGSRDKTIRIWDTHGRCVKALRGHGRSVLALVQLSTGQLASGARDSCIKLWNTATWECEASVSAHPGGNVLSLVETKYGILWSGSSDSTIKGWRISDSSRTLECYRELHGHQGWVWSLCQLDDQTLVSGSEDSTIKLWNIADGACKLTLQGHRQAVLCVLRLSDGRLASASMDKTIKIWQENHASSASPTEPWVCVQTITGHTKHVRCIVELPNGLLASGSEDSTIKIWRLVDGACLATLEHVNYVRALILASNTTQLISVAYDAAIKVWSFEPPQHSTEG